MTHRIFAALMALLVILLAMLGLGFSAAHFLNPPYNPGFADHPAIVKIHVVLGALYLLFGALQFVPWIRQRFIGYHRTVGRLLAAAGLVIGATAIFIGVVIPFSGRPEQIVMSVFGSYYLLSIVAAVFSVRRGDIDAHRRWMVRAYAIGSAVVTMRLIFIPLLIVTGAGTDVLAANLSIISFTAAFVMHAVAAEWWIARTRSIPIS